MSLSFSIYVFILFYFYKMAYNFDGIFFFSFLFSFYFCWYFFSSFLHNNIDRFIATRTSFISFTYVDVIVYKTAGVHSVIERGRATNIYKPTYLISVLNSRQSSTKNHRNAWALFGYRFEWFLISRHHQRSATESTVRSAYVTLFELSNSL